MIYVFDTSSLSELCLHFYESRFPSLWEKVRQLCDSGRLISVREAYTEIRRVSRPALSSWACVSRSLFQEPTGEELEMIGEIFKVEHFRQVVSKRAMYEGRPVADPFVVAKAAPIIGGTVVTQEVYKNNAARIPNICEHFGVRCINLEGLMTSEEWVF